MKVLIIGITLQYMVSCFFPTGCIGLILSYVSSVKDDRVSVQDFRDGMVFHGLLLPCLLALYCNKAYRIVSLGPYTLNSYKSLTKIYQQVLSHITSWASKIASRVKRLAQSHAFSRAPREMASSARTRETSRYIAHSRPVSRDEDQEI